MITHYILNDIEFEEQFKTGVLNLEIFNHEAHLRLAWIQINKYGIERAQNNIQKQLLAYVDKLGARHKYNTTLTVAAIKAVYHFMLKSESDTFKDFILEFPRLKHSFKNLMNSHYEIDIFSSEKARIEFIEPDLLPFD